MVAVCYAPMVGFLMKSSAWVESVQTRCRAPLSTEQSTEAMRSGNRWGNAPPCREPQQRPRISAGSLSGY